MRIGKYLFFSKQNILVFFAFIRMVSHHKMHKVSKHTCQMLITIDVFMVTNSYLRLLVVSFGKGGWG